LFDATRKQQFIDFNGLSLGILMNNIRSIFLLYLLLGPVDVFADSGANDQTSLDKGGSTEALSSADPLNLIDSIRREILDDQSMDVEIIAHRACWQSAPENSLPSLAACIHSGVKIVEVDVRRTKDRQLVLLHDETLDRTTNGSGFIHDYTLEEIKALRLRNRDGRFGKSHAALTQETIPTLRQALEFSRGKLILNLDVKDDDIAQQAFDEVDALNMGSQILVKLREAPDSKRLLNYTLPEGALFMPIIFQCNAQWQGFCGDTLSDLVLRYKQYKPIAFEIVFSELDYLKEGIDAIQSMNARIWVNTLSSTIAAGHGDLQALDDPDANWGLFRNLGVNMIQTDYPYVLKNYLDSLDKSAVNP